MRGIRIMNIKARVEIKVFNGNVSIDLSDIICPSWLEKVKLKSLNEFQYRVTHLLADWVALILIWYVPRLVGRYCSYLLPKHAGGTPQIEVIPTQVRQQMGRPV